MGERSHDNVRYVVNARFLCEPATGVGRFAIEISKQLKKLDDSIVFVCHEGIHYQETAKELDVVVYGKLKRMPWEQLELRLYMKKYPNALLINLANTAPLFFRRNVLLIHDILWFTNPEWYNKKAVLYMRLLTPRLVRQAVKILTVSNYSKGEIAKAFGLPKESIGVVYNAVGEQFVPLDDATSSRSRFEGRKYILAVSSIDPRKNFGRLIQAFFQSGVVEQGYELLVVGRKYKAFPDIDFELSTEQEKHVQFLGYVDDQELVELYQNAQLFCYPSLAEGFGIPPLEAMACGCPVITSNLTSIPEVCGDAVRYVDPYDVDMLSQIISTVLSGHESREGLIKNSFIQVKRFSWHCSAKSLLESIHNR